MLLRNILMRLANTCDLDNCECKIIFLRNACVLNLVASKIMCQEQSTLEGLFY